MVSIRLKKTLIAQPSAKRNFTTHLSYDAGTNSIAYPSGKSAIVRSLDTNTVIQFTGHGSAAVTVVKFSPRLGSNYVCSGDEHGKVIVWSYANQVDESAMVGTKIHSEFKVLAGAVTDISWDFEGSRLCVVGEGRDKFGAFITWDTGNSLGEVTGHSNRINACHMKQSRPMRAMTVGDNGTVVFYKGPPFQFSLSDRTHHGQGSFVRDVRFSPGAGKYAISVGSDRKIVVYDGTTGQFLKHIEDTTETCGGLFALDWIDEGDNSTQFVTSSADGKVRLWNVETGKVVQMWFVGSSLLDQQVGVAVTKDNSIVSLSLDGTLSIFKMGSSDAIRTLKGHSKGITALAVNPLVTASYDGNVFKWSDNDEPCLCATHSNRVTSVEYVKGSTSTVSWDKALKVDDQTQYEFAEQPKVSCSSNGIVAVITESNKLMVLDSLAGTLLNEVTLERPGNTVTIGSKYVAVGYEVTNSIEVFALQDLSERFVLANPLRACPSALSLSPSEEYLAAGDTMGKILLYDLKTKLVKTSRWSFHTGRITSISWRPSDGEEDHVATSSLDTHLFIYSVKRPMKVIKKLNAHKDGVNFVKWVSPDLFVSAGADACINKWTVVFA